MRDWRRVLEDIMVLGALAFLSASSFDKTEIQLVTAFGAYLAGRELTAHMPRKRLGYSYPEVAAACVLVLCVAVKCAHELSGRYWLAVTSMHGESDDAWIDRMAENWKERALTRGQPKAELHH